MTTTNGNSNDTTPHPVDEALFDFVLQLQRCFARHFYKIRGFDEVYWGMDPQVPGTRFEVDKTTNPLTLVIGCTPEADEFMQQQMAEFLSCLEGKSTRPADDSRDRVATMPTFHTVRIALTDAKKLEIAEFIGRESMFYFREEVLEPLARNNPEIAARLAASARAEIKGALDRNGADRMLTALERNKAQRQR